MYINHPFEQKEEEDYYKEVRVGYFYSNNYIEYARNGDKNKTNKYHDEINPYLKDIINNSKKSDTWKIQLKIAV